MSTETQSIYFMKPYFTAATAKMWLQKYNIIAMKNPHVKGNQIRFRIREPIYRDYVTKEVSPGVYFVLGIR